MSTGLFLTNGQWRPYPQGYQLGDHMYCPSHIIQQLPPFAGGREGFGELVTKDRVESMLEIMADNRGIDYSDEYSYDSDDFPKVITDTDEENHCATCGVDLREV